MGDNLSFEFFCIEFLKIKIDRNKRKMVKKPTFERSFTKEQELDFLKEIYKFCLMRKEGHLYHLDEFSTYVK